MPLTPEEWLNEFLTNTVDSAGGFNDQNGARVTQLSNGNFLVAWDSNANPGSGAGSTPSVDVIGRIFDPLGNAVTGEIQLNVGFEIDAEQSPEIAALPGDGFMVTNLDVQSSGATIQFDLRAQVFDNAGVHQRTFTILEDAAGGDFYSAPVVAASSDTNAMVLYVENGEDVIGRIYNPSNGLAVTSAFSVLNSTSSTGIAGVDLAVLDTGEYATISIDGDASPDDDDIYLNVWSGGGTVNHTRIISNSWEDISDPSLTVLDNGNLVLTYVVDGTGGSNTGVRARILNDSLTDVTGEFNPLTTTGGNQILPDVTALADGGFVIAWYDEDTNDIHAQRYNSAGTKVGTEFNMVQYGTSTVTSIDLAVMEDGRFLITWTQRAGTDDDIRTAIWDVRDNVNTTPAYDDNMQIGTIGNDLFTVDAGADEVYGWNGNDTVLVNSTDEFGVDFYGGSGTDTLQMRNPGTFTLTSSVINGFEEFKFNDGAGTGARSVFIFASAFNQFNTLDFAQSAGQIDRIEIEMGGQTNVDYSTLTIQDFIAADDTIIIDGDASAETIVGTTVNDTIRGGGGLDNLDGHTGIDTLDLSDGGYTGAAVVVDLIPGTIVSTQGNETAVNFENVIGSSIQDTVTGTSGSNVIEGNGGNDFIDGGDGLDMMYGGSGDDRFVIEGTGDINNGVEVIDGGIGTDTLQVSGVGNGNEFIQFTNEDLSSIEEIEFAGTTAAGDVNLTLIFSAEQFNSGDISLTALIDGFSSPGDNETLRVSMLGEDTLDLSGLTFIGWGTQNEVVDINGGTNNDTIIGTSQIDDISGGTGNDVIYGGVGADILSGNSGDDQIEGGAGDDTMNGDAGDDMLYNAADATTNTLNGGADTDTWVLGTIAGGFSGTNWTINLASGTSTGGTTTVNTSLIENVTAGNGDDNITGDGGANVLNGNGGADVINGGSGADTILGGSGDDIMIGGGGTDSFDGGSGIDTIDYSANSVGGTIDADVVNTGTATFGAITETWDNVENFITGTGDDIFLWSGAGTTVFDLDGGSGTDRFDASNSSSNWNVDLTLGEADVGTTLRANLSNIEDVTGNNTNNTIIGNSMNNTLIGGGGNDMISGQGGTADVLIGGLGDDTIETFGSDGSSVQGNEGDDLLGFSVVTGLSNLSGGNTFDGGADTDTFSFSTFSGSYTVDLAGGTFFRTSDNAHTNTLMNIENVTAGNGSDTLIGDANANVLDGGNGNDTINGGSGNDTILGGAGNDTIQSGNGVDSIDAGAGNDVVIIDQANADYSGGETYDGGANTDEVRWIGNYFLGSTVTFDMEAGELIQGTTVLANHVNFENYDSSGLTGQSDETVIGTSANNIITTGFGNNTIDGGGGNDTLDGGDGDDTIEGGDGDDTIEGGDGDDSIEGGAGADTLTGGTGNDTLSYAGDTAGVTVFLSNNAVSGGDANGDTVSGFENITGGSGDDNLNGNSQVNILTGNDGVDSFFANGGADIVYGGDGNDTLRGGIGDDLIFGGEGNDNLQGNNQQDILHGDAGDDEIIAGGGNDDLFGGDDNDTLTGNSGQDELFGGNGNDDLSGNAGGDDLFGGAGADRLHGGGGNDDMTGDAGADIFEFTTGFGVDRIKDFEDGTDLIDVSGHSSWNNFADILADATQTGLNVIIQVNSNNRMVIENFDLADLDATDFIF